MKPYRVNEDGRLKYEYWCDENGVHHREDGPAYTSYHSNGSLELVFWAIHGVYHRFEGPAVESYYSDGSIQEKSWYTSGNRIKTILVKREYDVRKKLIQEDWYLDGRRCREDGGPISIRYAKDDRTTIETWGYDFTKHREDGPAVVVKLDGKVINQFWYLDNKKVMVKTQSGFLASKARMEYIVSSIHNS